MGKYPKYYLNNNFIEISSKSVKSMYAFKVSKVTLCFNYNSKKNFYSFHVAFELKIKFNKDLCSK